MGIELRLATADEASPDKDDTLFQGTGVRVATRRLPGCKLRSIPMPSPVRSFVMATA
jgi:hypothetical protein